jgi:hypothetical protein
VRPHRPQHRWPDDERPAGIRSERQGDERLAEPDVVGDERPAMLIQHHPCAGDRLPLVRMQRDAA